MPIRLVCSVIGTQGRIIDYPWIESINDSQLISRNGSFLKYQDARWTVMAFTSATWLLWSANKKSYLQHKEYFSYNWTDPRWPSHINRWPGSQVTATKGTSLLTTKSYFFLKPLAFPQRFGFVFPLPPEANGLKKAFVMVWHHHLYRHPNSFLLDASSACIPGRIWWSPASFVSPQFVCAPSQGGFLTLRPKCEFRMFSEFCKHELHVHQIYPLATVI